MQQGIAGTGLFMPLKDNHEATAYIPDSCGLLTVWKQIGENINHIWVILLAI